MSTLSKNQPSSAKKVFIPTKSIDRVEYSHVPVNHLDFNKKHSKPFTSH